MSTQSIVVSTIVILFSSFTTAAALTKTQISTSQDGSAEARAEIKVQVSESKDSMLEAREKLRVKLQEGQTDVMQKIGELHAIRLENRFTFYYSRLKKIYDRLGTQITNMETQFGADKLAKAKSLWTQAGLKLEEAKTLGGEVVVDFRAVEGSDLKSQRAEVFEARDDAKSALAAYKEATRLMKEATKELRLVERVNRPSPSPKPSRSPRASTTPFSKSLERVVPVKD